jgi:hypothetical protein
MQSPDLASPVWKRVWEHDTPGRAAQLACFFATGRLSRQASSARVISAPQDGVSTFEQTPRR